MQVLYFLIDHGNPEIDLVQHTIGDTVRATPRIYPYDTSYLQTIRNIVGSIHCREKTTIWVCSSISDYRDFDFELPFDGYNDTHFHVYPSNDLEQGDTFVFDYDTVEANLRTTEDLQLLGIVNYDKPSIPRLLAPSIHLDTDSQIDIKKHSLEWPYVFCEIEENRDPAVPSMWTFPPIIVNSSGATHVTMPKIASTLITEQCYDYPYIIDKTSRKSLPLDIVFIANGETDAEKNWNRLLEVTQDTRNRVTRVDGVQGRVQAYQAAARASNTSWFFTVFAKLWVDEEFDWDWQPDRLQKSKHYIFHALNPVNGLVYGHQAMIAYNKKLVLANQGRGLDFTLDDLHAVVEVMSGEARFNTDLWSTWRTAFREAIKLKADNTEISKSRLNIWLTASHGSYGDWSIKGSMDALEYYYEVEANPAKLKLSYEWDWLKAKFKDKGYVA